MQLPQFLKRVQNAVTTLRAAPVLARVGPNVRNIVASEAPIRTGRLRKGHTFTVTQRRLVIQVTGVPYAGYVYYGTRRQAANPWLDRGLARAGPLIERELDKFGVAVLAELRG